MLCLGFLGPLGSGKTTLLRKLLRDRLLCGTTLLIVNDVGKVNVDAVRLEGLADMRPLTAGCIGCSDVASFVQIVREAQERSVDNLIIEPTGIADGREIRDALRECGEDLHAITLWSVKHHMRNLALGVAVTQLEVADIVGLTWFEKELGPSPSFDCEPLADIVETCRVSAPGVPFVLLPKFIGTDDIGSILELVRNTSKTSSSNTVRTDSPTHGHGIHRPPVDLRFRHGVSFTDLEAVLRKIGPFLVRAKGAVRTEDSVREFDFVQGDLNLGDPSNAEPGGNFIPWTEFDREALMSLAVKNPYTDKKRLLREGRDIPLDATLDAIQWQLKQYPPVISPSGELRVDCEADSARQLIEREGVSPRVRKETLQRYVDWRLEGLRVLRSRDWRSPDLPYWKRRLGAVLCWHAVHCPMEIGENRIQEIVQLDAPACALESLAGIQELSFLEEKAEERPDVVLDCIQFGLARKCLQPKLVETVIDHCLALSEGNDDWHQRWREVEHKIHPHVCTRHDHVHCR